MNFSSLLKRSALAAVLLAIAALPMFVGREERREIRVDGNSVGSRLAKQHQLNHSAKKRDGQVSRRFAKKTISTPSISRCAQ